MVHESSFYIPSLNVERETTEEDKKGEAQQKVYEYVLSWGNTVLDGSLSHWKWIKHATQHVCSLTVSINVQTI